MDAVPLPSKISRIDLRYRHFAEEVSQRPESLSEREIGIGQKEGESRLEDAESRVEREQKARAIMGRAHGLFHRRQAQNTPSNVLTVVVDVVATVDAAGNIIAQETITPTVNVPTLPSVPAVPPFPSGLTVPQVPALPTVPLPSVPPYPFGSSSSLAPSSVTSSGAPTIATPFALNSTTTSFAPSSTFISTARFNSTSHSSSRSSSSSSHSSSSSTRSSSSISSSTSIASSTTSLAGVGGGGPAATAPAPAATSSGASNTQDGNNATLATPKVVGSVVGSLAGAAILLALILFLIKRHKQKLRNGALQLPGNDAADSQPIASSGQQMATTSNPARGSFAAGGAAAFFNRFSGASRSTADTSTTGEKGFQRISGRKLPSAFSEGMTSEQFAREGTLSGSSFYRDDQGFYGGPGVAAAATSKEFGKEIGEPSGPAGMGTKERIMPSPARTPVIYHPEDAPPFGASRNGGGTALSPPHSPNPDAIPRGTLGRSHPSHDGSRGSRFTEDV